MWKMGLEKRDVCKQSNNYELKWMIPQSRSSHCSGKASITEILVVLVKNAAFGEFPKQKEN